MADGPTSEGGAPAAATPPDSAPPTSGADQGGPAPNPDRPHDPLRDGIEAAEAAEFADIPETPAGYNLQIKGGAGPLSQAGQDLVHNVMHAAGAAARRRAGGD